MRFVTALLVFLWTLPAAAQEFSVIAADPASGASSVALQTTVRFTFSAPVDTSFRFTDVSTLPVEFYAISPADSIQIVSTYFNEDLTELSFDVTHTDSTDFVWIMTGALDEAGVLLCQPYVLSYTTADTTGDWSVSGTVVTAVLVKRGSCHAGLRAIAVLRDAPLGEEGTVVAAAVADDEANYTIDHVREGVYWPAGFSDHRNPGVFGSSMHERGFYDPERDEQPNSLAVADSNRTGVHMEIFDTSSTTQHPTEVPGVAALLPNYPNPFNPETTLAFRLEHPMHVTLTVFDVLGRQVATVGERFYMAGSHTETWSAGDVPSGLYVVRLQGERFQLARPVMLIK